MATFWEIAAYLVSHFCKLYFDCVILVISRSDFKCGIWLLIAPVPFHSFLVTFNYEGSVKSFVQSTIKTKQNAIIKLFHFISFKILSIVRYT